MHTTSHNDTSVGKGVPQHNLHPQPKSISRLHVITDDLNVILQACAAGADWIQLRIKGQSMEVIEQTATSALDICNSHGATLIINDHVQLTKKIKAHGVHLGKNDMHPQEAREFLGPDCIIGGTANIIEDIRAIQHHVNYIGLGPFRFTQTKQNLSPTLGLEGIEALSFGEGLGGVPIIAIGGITAADVYPLLETGVHGVAVSSAIAKADDIQQATRAFARACRDMPKTVT